MIELTQGKFTVVDDDDFIKFGNINWHYSHGRAVNRNARAGVHNRWLHREIMGNPAGLVVDHINGNPLDNRKQNLRIVTQSLNAANSRKQSTRKTSSIYKGVSYNKNPAARNKWHAYIGSPGKDRINLGMYATEEEAALAYNKAARNRWGVNAQVNPIGDEYTPPIDECPTCFRKF